MTVELSERAARELQALLPDGGSPADIIEEALARLAADNGKVGPCGNVPSNGETWGERFAKSGFIGCGDGPSDLSTNPGHLDDIGRS